jgi:hypothetical protein
VNPDSDRRIVLLAEKIKSKKRVDGRRVRRFALRRPFRRPRTVSGRVSSPCSSEPLADEEVGDLVRAGYWALREYRLLQDRPSSTVGNDFRRQFLADFPSGRIDAVMSAARDELRLFPTVAHSVLPPRRSLPITPPTPVTDFDAWGMALLRQFLADERKAAEERNSVPPPPATMLSLAVMPSSPVRTLRLRGAVAVDPFVVPPNFLAQLGAQLPGLRAANPRAPWVNFRFP